jgi:hypothetical protein
MAYQALLTGHGLAPPNALRLPNGQGLGENRQRNEKGDQEIHLGRITRSKRIYNRATFLRNLLKELQIAKMAAAKVAPRPALLKSLLRNHLVAFTSAAEIKPGISTGSKSATNPQNL